MRIYFTIASISILCLALFSKYIYLKWTPSTGNNSIPSITGLDIYDMDLCDTQNITPAVITNLTSLIYEHGYIILKKQCKQFHNKISAETLEFIAKQFGEPAFHGAFMSIEESKFIKMLTNNGTIEQGIVGSMGWHIDDVSQAIPSSLILMYVQNAPHFGRGGTRFLHGSYFLEEMQSKHPSIYNLWNRLFFGSFGYILHPIIALHPITSKHHMVIETAFSRQIIEVLDMSMMRQINDEFKGQSAMNATIEALIFSYVESNKIRVYSGAERKELWRSMEKFIEESEFMHVTSYEDGDLLIRDNFAMLHIADRTTQLSVKEIGLRAIWTIDLEGAHVTSKY